MASERLLGEFLRARRAVTTPAQVGLPDAGLRRTPGLRMDVLAINPPAAAFYGPGLKVGDNVLGAIFLDAAARRFYPDWESAAHDAVAHLRATAGRDLDDPRLARLVRELSDRSGDFRRVWARYDVRTEISRVIRFRHDLVGELTPDYDMFSVAEAPGRRLVTIQAAPGSPSAHALAALCGQARERDPAAGHPARCSDTEDEGPVHGGASC